MSKKLDLSKIDRRKLLKLLNTGLVTTPFVGGLSPLLLSQQANAATNPHRFLQIFLTGGWDMAMSTDPANGGKGAHGDFNAYWKSDDPNFVGNALGGQAGYAPSTDVTGATNLKVGWGLKNLIDAPNKPALGGAGALQRIPTTFVNGMFVEVTAHELAVAYMLSGKLSLSRSREYPAIVATMADKLGGFPAHMVLGENIPLGETKFSNPPLQSADTALMEMMMAGPKYVDPNNGDDFSLKDASISSADSLLNLLNSNFGAGLAAKPSTSLDSWNNADAGMAAFYAQNYASQVAIDGIKAQYGLNGGQYTSSSGMDARMASAFKVIESGMTRFVTVNFGGFDTHQNHNNTHLPLMQNFSTLLNQLVYDLTMTDDPLDPGKKLSDNTTILITSDFNRTPIYNQTAGTDHWRTGTAILMGRGVRSNNVVGLTNDQGYALNLAGDTVINTSQDSGVLLPDHLAAALMRHLGFTQEAEELTNVDISSLLFT